MKILITGAAGFIGYHLTKKIIENGDDVIGIDNINNYYDPKLKYGRLADLGIYNNHIEYNQCIRSKKYFNFKFIKLNIKDKDKIENLFKNEQFDIVCNLAAQAGVRYSLDNPHSYIDSNIVGFLNILEGCRANNIKHLVFASSSSVYGLNEKIPFSTSDNVDHPINLYAATKKSNELMAHTYSYLFNIPVTGLRFFTVYGPWGRPDMAYFLFTKAIFEDKPIDIYNYGNMKRDFTYIDDIIEGLVKIINNPPKSNPEWAGINLDPSSSKSPYKIYNIGNNDPVNLMNFVKVLENALGKKAKINYLPLQSGDMLLTYADVNDLVRDFKYKPDTSIKEGIESFVKWYREFYKM